MQSRPVAAGHTQVMPGPLTVPAPTPAVATVSRNLAKVAVTARATLIVTVQSSVPVQAPFQPTKPEPAAGVAVNLTTARGA